MDKTVLSKASSHSLRTYNVKVATLQRFTTYIGYGYFFNDNTYSYVNGVLRGCMVHTLCSHIWWLIATGTNNCLETALWECRNRKKRIYFFSEKSKRKLYKGGYLFCCSWTARRVFSILRWERHFRQKVHYMQRQGSWIYHMLKAWSIEKSGDRYWTKIGRG